jgi:hypothetical protein
MVIQEFSSIQFKISETGSSGSSNATFTYHVTSSTGGIYKVNLSLISTSTVSLTMVVDANNDTVLSVTGSGYTVTGATAKVEFDSFMGLFGLQEYYGAELGVLTDSAYFHATGTAPMTFGQATFPVTTYEANSLPLTVNECGISSTITAYTLGVGTPTGTSLQFITYLHIVTTSPQSEDVTFQLVSMTVA